MNSNQKLKKSQPEKTYDLIRKGLKETHALDGEKTSNALSEEKGWLAFLRKSLLEKPLITCLVITIFLLIFIGLGALVIQKLINNIYVRLLYFLFAAFLYAFVPIFVQIITPKSDMGYDEIWSRTVSFYLRETGIDNDQKYTSNLEKLNEARRRIKRGIHHYRRQGEWLSFIMNLMWGGVFIGCLPDPEFQKALVTLSPIEIWNKNQFGAFSLLLLPFIAAFYSSFYGLPIAWMEQIASQVELED
jgi:hypothetical protein